MTMSPHRVTGTPRVHNGSPGFCACTCFRCRRPGSRPGLSWLPAIPFFSNTGTFSWQSIMVLSKCYKIMIMVNYGTKIKWYKNGSKNGTVWRHFFRFQWDVSHRWLCPPGSRQSEPRPEPSHGDRLPWFLSHKQIINRYGYGHKMS